MDTCEICLVNEAVAWDHDHVSGKIRGHLCGPCNIGLGCFRDDTDRLKQAIAYLERPLSDADFADYKREYRRLATAKWRAAHREEERERVRQRYAEDPERFREYQRRWKRDDADGEKKRRAAENRRRWMAEHPGKAEEYEANRREARKAELREKGRERYRRDMADPEKKAKERERIREYKRKKRAEQKGSAD